jgi:hypothetical protein
MVGLELAPPFSFAQVASSPSPVNFMAKQPPLRPDAQMEGRHLPFSPSHIWQFHHLSLFSVMILHWSCLFICLLVDLQPSFDLSLKVNIKCVLILGHKICFCQV